MGIRPSRPEITGAVEGLRTRYGAAGNKAGHSDAHLLADVLRTDGHRLRSLEPDSEATVALRALVRARADRVGTRVGITTQLRAHLRVAFPGAVGLFHELDCPISLRFLERFECQVRAAWLSPARLGSWLARNGYCGRMPAAELHRRLTQAPIGAGHGAEDPVVRALVGTPMALRSQIAALETRIGEALDAHPDGPIFASLPRAGTVRAAKPLAEIGDVRERFPDPESPAALAGVVPSTRQSGRHRAVALRWAADLKLREPLCDFAGDSRHANAWAADRYRALRAAGKRHPHAERILARSWAHIIWRCWQDRVPYDPERHGALRGLATIGG